ncbi:MAG TPA: nucleotidyltransferase domain-containing protein [Nanoarchaeota archaeon]|nr:nucleotidyltransferase domain-containing protein [Nanoarchaeota archaeon]
MLIDVCMGNRTSWKILILMAEAPGKALSKTDIQRHTKIGSKALLRFILLLKKFNVISEMQSGKRFLYRLNMANPVVPALMSVINAEKEQLNAVYFDTAIALREFVYGLANMGIEGISKVILFGSVAKHTASVDSDIDVAIVTKGKNPRLEADVSVMCGGIQERFKREIQPHFLTEEEFGAKTKLAEEIRKDGIVLI